MEKTVNGLKNKLTKINGATKLIKLIKFKNRINPKLKL